MKFKSSIGLLLIIALWLSSGYAGPSVAVVFPGDEDSVDAVRNGTCDPPQNLLASQGTYGYYIELTWEAPTAGTPESYNIYRSQTVTQPPDHFMNTTNLIYQDSDTNADEFYNYWVTSVCLGEESGPSNRASGWRTNQAPLEPAYPVPANGVIDVPLTVILSWTSGDIDGDTVLYDVYLDTVNPPQTLVSDNQTGTTFTPPVLASGTTYYWQVVADDQQTRAISEGPVWQFTTEYFCYFTGNIALHKPTTASSELDDYNSSYAVDGNISNDWNSGFAATPSSPQDISIIYQGICRLDSIALRTNQDDDNLYYEHVVSTFDSLGARTIIDTIRGTFNDAQWLPLVINPPVTNAAVLNIETLQSSGSWVSWAEIQTFGCLHTLGDTTRPEISCPDTVFTECTVPEAFTDFYDFLANGGLGSDNNSLDTLTFTLLSEISDDNPCPETIIRTYQVQDTWGNAGQCQHAIVLRDTTPPILNCPGNLAGYTTPYANLPAWLVAGGGVSDNCAIDSTSFALVSETSDGNVNPETIDRVYQIEDRCGNSARCTQQLVVYDLTAPSATTITVIDSTFYSLTVRWTSTGDDGLTGVADRFDLRYSMTPILTQEAFLAAPPVLGIPLPDQPGTIHTFEVMNLIPETDYYFAIKVGDEVPNWSNYAIANGRTIAAPDTIAPAPICDIRVFEVSTSTVTLAWKAVGDDSLSGYVDRYDIRYSPDDITTDNYFSATPWPELPEEPSPRLPGEWEFVTITGLTENVPYYFAIRAFDESNNLSDFCVAISGVPQPSRRMVLESTTDDIEIVYLNGIKLWKNNFQYERSSREIAFLPGETYVIAMRVNDVGGPSGGHLTSLSDVETGEVILNTQADGNWKYIYSFPGQDWFELGFDDSGWAAEQLISNYGEGYAPITGWVDTSAKWIWGVPDVHYELWVRRTFTVSNIVADVDAPANVTDLTATPLTSSHVQLTWISPGDNGIFGQATEYEIRYAGFEMDETSFFNGTQVANPPTPQWSGEREIFIVSGLAANTQYYFALRTADEVPNWSGISNNAAATTNLPPDETGPEQVTDLAIENVGATLVTLTWTTPADAGQSGQVIDYEFYYSTVALTPDNYLNGTRIIPNLPLLEAGQTQTYAISGLLPETEYHFILRAADGVGNWSAMSNTVSATTDELFIPENLCLNKPTTASTNSFTAYRATDGEADTQWSANAYYPQWIEVDFQGLATLDSLAFRVAQFPSGMCIHEIHVTHGNGSQEKVHTFSQFMVDEQWLVHRFEVPPTSVQKMRVKTVLSTAPVAWYEIQAFGVLLGGDDTPPAAIDDLAIIGANNTFVTLGWNSPGDDDNEGQAAFYDLRYATQVITAENFALAATVPNEPSPEPAGTFQTYTVNDLVPDTFYYFAIKTSDELYNWSSLSNVVGAVTDEVFHGTIIVEDICADQTWTPAGNPYIILNDIEICANTTLTIEPGTYVRFGGQTELRIRAGGSLLAQGTNDNPILLESGGLWDGLYFMDASNGSSVLDNVTFNNVGYWAVRITDGDNVTVRNCDFQNIESNCAIFLDHASPLIESNTLRAPICSSDGTSNPTIRTNTFIGSGDYPITVGAMSVIENNNLNNWQNGLAIRFWATDVVVDSFWPNITAFPYYVDGDIIVSAGATLTIAQGAVTFWAADAHLQIGHPQTLSFGSLQANGVSNQVIQFRGDPLNTTVNWQGIVFTPYTIDAALTFCQIQDAEYIHDAVNRAAIAVLDNNSTSLANTTVFTDTGIHAVLLENASITLQNNTFHSSVYVTEANSRPQLRSNTFVGSGQYPISMGAMGYLETNNFSGWTEASGIRIWPTTITSDARWTHPVNLSYQVQGDIDIENGATLVIDPGVPAYFSAGAQMRVGRTAAPVSTGSLQINGQALSRPRLSGINPDAYWEGILFSAQSVHSWLDYTVIDRAYQVYTDNQGGAIYINAAETVAISHSDIQPALNGHAVILKDSPVTLAANTFRGSVYIADNASSPVLTQNIFAGTGPYPLTMGAMTHLSGNNFNSWDGDYIKVWSTVIVRDVTWPDHAVMPYLADGSIFIGGEATFSIDAGVLVDWRDQAQLVIGDRTSESTGHLDVNGTADQPVVFSAYDPEITTSWYGLYFTEYTGASEVSYLHVNAARAPIGNERYVAVRFHRVDTDVTLDQCTLAPMSDGFPIWLEGSSPTIQYCHITSGANYAVNATDGTSNPSLVGNTFVGQGDFPYQVGAMSHLSGNDYTEWDGEIGIRFLGTTITRPTTWPNRIEAIGPYYLFGDIMTQSTLSINGGTTCLFDNYTKLKATAGGSIQAVGQPTSTGYITFSSMDGEQGTWTGIEFDTDAAESRIAYALVELAGDFFPYAGIYIHSQAAVTIDHCDLIRNYGTGLYVQYSNPEVHSTISAFNSGYGFDHMAGGTPNLTFCDAFGNNAGNFHGLLDPSGGGTNFSSDPLFVDMPEGDFQLEEGSPCRGTGRNGTSVGIFQYADETGPSPVLNLTVIGSTGSSVTLRWIATGDDAVYGRAAEYDLRYSLVNITAANFTGATPVAGEPSPQGSGRVEVFTVDNLLPNRQYYFALQVHDDAGNVSLMSNVVSTTTITMEDDDPPGMINNLTVIGTTFNSITIQWTAPGDDGYAGQAVLYDCRYSTSLLSGQNFLNATLAIGEPLPLSSGNSQVFTIYGLEADQMYYIALRTKDEVNWSPISNVVSAETNPYQPEAGVTENPHHFGSVMIGFPRTWEMTVVNAGALPLNITGIASTSANFVVDNVNFTIQPGESQIVPVIFDPPTIGNHSGQIRINSNDPDTPLLIVNVSGTGILPNQPRITIPDDFNDFGAVNLNQEVDWHFTIRNDGGVPLVIENIDSDVEQFTITMPTYFPYTLPPQGQITVRVRFRPTIMGSYLAQLTIPSNDPDHPVRIVTLEGYGQAFVPILQYNELSHHFGAVYVDDYADWHFPIWNSGTANLTVTVSTTDANFDIIEPSSPTRQVMPGDTLRITIRFDPNSVGAHSGYLRLQTNDQSTSFVQLPIFGEALATPVPETEVSVTSHDFGHVFQGYTERWSFTVSNIGQAPMTITAAGFSGGGAIAYELIQPTAYPQNIDPEQSVNFTIDFTPIDITQYSTTLQIYTTDPNMPLISVALIGRGTAIPDPDISAPLTGHDFGPVSGSDEWSFVIYNVGDGPLVIENITVDQTEFVITHPVSFPQDIPSGEYMQVYVMFTPVDIEPVAGTLQIFSNDPDPIENPVNLTLRGGRAAALAEFNATSHDFLPTLLNQSSTWLLIISNPNGSIPLEIISLDFSNEQFSIPELPDLPLSILPGSQQALGIRFAPTQLGDISGQLTVVSNAENWPTRVIQFSGTGITPEIAVSQTFHNFQRVLIGQADTWSFTIENSGTGPLSIYSMTSSLPDIYSVNTTRRDTQRKDEPHQPKSNRSERDWTIPANAAMEVTITFQPEAHQFYEGTITITNSDLDEPSPEVVLLGRGVAPVVDILEDSHDFGQVLINTEMSWSLPIHNNGDAELVLSMPEFTNDRFSLGETVVFPVIIPIDQSAAIPIVFQPDSPEMFNSLFTMDTNDPFQNSVSIVLTGQGLAPQMTLSADGHSFGEIPVSDTASWEFDITNTGSAPLHLYDLILDSDVFAIEFPATRPTERKSTSRMRRDFPDTLGVGQSLTLTITFAPPLSQDYSDTLQIVSDSFNNPTQTVVLSGEGVGPQIVASGLSHDFGTVAVGDVASWIVTLSNQGIADLIITGLEMSNPAFSAEPFAVPIFLPFDSSLVVPIKFAPLAEAEYSGEFRVYSNDPNSNPLAIELTGVGLAAEIHVPVTALDFGEVMTDSMMSFLVHSVGSVDLHVYSLLTSDERFSIQTSWPFIVAVGDSHEVAVRFTPEPGDTLVEAALTIRSNDPATPEAVVTLQGSSAQVAVELISFAAVGKVGAVALDWEFTADSTPGLIGISRHTEPYAAGAVEIASIIVETTSPTFQFADDSVENDLTYFYWLVVYDTDGSTVTFGPVSAIPIPRPENFSLSQNYPNPFNPVTTISYAVPHSGPISLKVYAVTGQLIRTLVEDHRELGYYDIQWDGTTDNGQTVASGIYYYQLRAGDYQHTKRMTLMK